MRRTSYLAELEALYVYALNCKNMPAGTASPFMLLLQEYIDEFYDKADVLEDLKPYLVLLNHNTDDVTNVRDMLREKVRMTEIAESEPNS